MKEEVLIEVEELKIIILGSTSSGNCVLVNDIAFDFHLNKKKMIEVIEKHKIKHIFFTHEHGDHLPSAKKTFIDLIKKNRDVTVYGMKHVLENKKIDLNIYQNNIVQIAPNKTYYAGDVAIHVHRGEHGSKVGHIEVLAFTFYINGLRIMYSTDNTLLPTVNDQVPVNGKDKIETFVPFDKNNFSLVMAEGNHSKTILTSVDPNGGKNWGKSEFRNSRSHNSQEGLLTFLEENSNPFSLLFVLHKSQTEGVIEVEESSGDFIEFVDGEFIVLEKEVFEEEEREFKTTRVYDEGFSYGCFLEVPYKISTKTNSEKWDVFDINKDYIKETDKDIERKKDPNYKRGLENLSERGRTLQKKRIKEVFKKYSEHFNYEEKEENIICINDIGYFINPYGFEKRQKRQITKISDAKELAKKILKGEDEK